MIDETTIVGDYAFESGSNKFRLSNFTDNEPTNIKVFTNESPNNTDKWNYPLPIRRFDPVQKSFQVGPVNKRLYPIWAGNTLVQISSIRWIGRVMMD